MRKYIHNFIINKFSLLSKRARIMLLFYSLLFLVVLSVAIVIIYIYWIFFYTPSPSEMELALRSIKVDLKVIHFIEQHSIADAEWNSTVLQPEAQADTVVNCSGITRLIKFLSCTWFFNKSFSIKSAIFCAIDYRLFKPILLLPFNWLAPFVQETYEAILDLNDRLWDIIRPRQVDPDVGDAVDNFIPRLTESLNAIIEEALAADRVRNPNPLLPLLDSPDPEAFLLYPVVEELVPERIPMDPVDQYAVVPFVPVLADPVLDAIAEELGEPVVFDGVTYAAVRDMPLHLDIESIQARRFLAFLGLSDASEEYQRIVIDDAMSLTQAEFDEIERRSFAQAMVQDAEAFEARRDARINDAWLRHYDIHEEGPADLAADAARAEAEWYASILNISDNDPYVIIDWDLVAAQDPDNVFGVE